MNIINKNQMLPWSLAAELLVPTPIFNYNSRKKYATENIFPWGCNWSWELDPNKRGESNQDINKTQYLLPRCWQSATSFNYNSRRLVGSTSLLQLQFQRKVHKTTILFLWGCNWSWELDPTKRGELRQNSITFSS